MRIRLPRTLFILSISSPMLLRPLQPPDILHFSLSRGIRPEADRQPLARLEQPSTRLRRILDSRSSRFILENLARDRFALRANSR